MFMTYKRFSEMSILDIEKRRTSEIDIKQNNDKFSNAKEKKQFYQHNHRYIEFI